MDIVLTAVGGVLILPLVVAIALAIKIRTPGPVFYSQERVGQGGQRFRAWKFRSMVVNAEQVLEECLRQDPQRREEWRRYQKLKNDPRVTRLGRILRRTSLDEFATALECLAWRHELGRAAAFLAVADQGLSHLSPLRSLASRHYRPLAGQWSQFHDVPETLGIRRRLHSELVPLVGSLYSSPDHEGRILLRGFLLMSFRQLYRSLLQPLHALAAVASGIDARAVGSVRRNTGRAGRPARFFGAVEDALVPARKAAAAGFECR